MRSQEGQENCRRQHGVDPSVLRERNGKKQCRRRRVGGG